MRAEEEARLLEEQKRTEVRRLVSNVVLMFVGTLPRVRPRNGILALVVVVLVVVPLRSEFIGEL